MQWGSVNSALPCTILHSLEGQRIIWYLHLLASYWSRWHVVLRDCLRSSASIVTPDCGSRIQEQQLVVTRPAMRHAINACMHVHSHIHTRTISPVSPSMPIAGLAPRQRRLTGWLHYIQVLLPQVHCIIIIRTLLEFAREDLGPPLDPPLEWMKVTP